MPARSSWAAYTSEALGDYCAGPNHVLPTSRTARFSSPLGVYDFQKRTQPDRGSRAGAQTLGQIAGRLAHGEAWQAHAAAPSCGSSLRAGPRPRDRESGPGWRSKA